MSMATNPASKVVTNTRKRSVSTEPRRLTPATEEHIREMIAGPGFNSPTIRVCMLEIDALRAELAEERAKYG
jgi:hypothetical protein